MPRLSVSLTDEQMAWLNQTLSRTRAIRLLIEYAMENDIQPWRQSKTPSTYVNNAEGIESPTLTAEALQRMQDDPEKMPVLMENSEVSQNFYSKGSSSEPNHDTTDPSESDIKHNSSPLTWILPKDGRR